MKRRLFRIAGLSVILFWACLAWTAHRDELRLQKVAVYMSGSAAITPTGGIAFLIPDYPDHDYYIVAGAYRDPRQEITRVIGADVSHRIRPPETANDLQLYVVLKNGRMYNAEIYLKPEILTHLSHSVIKNPPAGPHEVKLLLW